MTMTIDEARRLADEAEQEADACSRSAERDPPELAQTFDLYVVASMTAALRSLADEVDRLTAEKFLSEVRKDVETL